MTELMYNMLTWKYWLGKKDFDAAVDHKAIPHIMKAKYPPTTDRIGRLLFGLNAFTFHLYYVKGKDMILCDFLSRVAADGGDPMDLVPVAFNGMSIMHERYNHMDEYEIMTRMQRVAAVMPAPPPVHGANKAVNPKLRPEKHAVTYTCHLVLPTPTIATEREIVRYSPKNPILTPSGPDLSALNNKSSQRLQGTISTPINN